MTYHLLYTTKDYVFHDEIKAFDSFGEVEAWLLEIGAIYWEIGLPE